MRLVLRVVFFPLWLLWLLARYLRGRSRPRKRRREFTYDRDAYDSDKYWG